MSKEKHAFIRYSKTKKPYLGNLPKEPDAFVEEIVSKEIDYYKLDFSKLYEMALDFCKEHNIPFEELSIIFDGYEGYDCYSNNSPYLEAKIKKPKDELLYKQQLAKHIEYMEKYQKAIEILPRLLDEWEESVKKDKETALDRLLEQAEKLKKELNI